MNEKVLIEGRWEGGGGGGERRKGGLWGEGGEGRGGGVERVGGEGGRGKRFENFCIRAIQSKYVSNKVEKEARGAEI